MKKWCNFTSFLLIFGLLVVVAVASSSVGDENKLCNSPELYDEHPILCQMLDRLYQDGETFANEITAWSKSQGLLVGSDWPELTINTSQQQQQLHPTSSVVINGDVTKSQQLPVVFAHGMGDSCFNSGMKKITQYTSHLLNDVYTICIPTGKTQSEDTSNGYFLNMDASVDVFAKSVQDDPKLAGGFHAIGFSQGNNVIRGYIARYNEPKVDTFLSINGVNAGEGALPECFPGKQQQQQQQDSPPSSSSSSSLTHHVGLSGMCDLLMEQASRRAYTDFAQRHSFQANYWRDPRPTEREAYQKYSQLARWNNEGEPFNQTLKDNFAKTKKFIWVMATKDEMVWPKEGEHWGAPDPEAPFYKILKRNETEWYTKDLFGLRTAEEQVKFCVVVVVVVVVV